MTIVIECSPDAMFRLFETKTIHSGMSREVPGGATIQLGEFPMQTRNLPTMQAALVPILVTIGTAVVTGVTIKVLADWISDRVKGDRKGLTMIRVNRVLVEATPDAITKILVESIEIEKKQSR